MLSDSFQFAGRVFTKGFIRNFANINVRIIPFYTFELIHVQFSIGICYLARRGTTGSLEGLVLIPRGIRRKSIGRSRGMAAQAISLPSEGVRGSSERQQVSCPSLHASPIQI